MTFDLILIAVIVVIAIWEAFVAIRRDERKRFALVAGALAIAGVLFYLRSPQIFGE